tara:strand:+ start:131 stop:385 length:255 start_codon:yes stop_codon:yes gene_type:complete
MNRKKIWYVIAGILIIGQFILNNNLKSQNKDFQAEIESLKEINDNQEEYIDYIYVNILTPLNLDYKGNEVEKEYIPQSQNESRL